MANIDEMASQWRRRLNVLKLNEARHGINTAPEVSIEIEDIERKLKQVDDIKQQLKLLDTHRKNAIHYVNQIASMTGQHATASQANGLREARTNIQRVKTALWQYYSYSVDPAPEDEEPPQVTQSAIPARPVEYDTLALIRENLDVLQEYVESNTKQGALRHIRMMKQLAARG